MHFAMMRRLRAFALLAAVAVAAASPLTAGRAAAADGAAPAAPSMVLPKPLSEADAGRYREIFVLQEKGAWKKADAAIAGLSDRLLMGHVLAQRYLHPTAYRSTYKELKAWMDEYADHPDAARLYKLALHRRPANWRHPKAPEAGSQNGPAVAAAVRIVQPPGKLLSKSERRQVAAYKRQIRWQLRKGWTKAVKQFITSNEAKRLFSDFDMDEAKARLGAGYFAAGRDDWAIAWAGEAAARSGRWLPEANWTAGLASWRLGRLDDAARHFEAVLVPGASDWVMSAGAFWAARAHLVGRKPERVNDLLGRAAAYPRTFYGMLARHMLGLKTEFTWQIPELEGPALLHLAEAPGGRRALGLVQVGETRRAERDLRGLAMRLDQDRALGVLALASRAGMPALAIRLNNQLFPGSGGFDGAAYPLPDWGLEDGFSVDRALVYALIRQESGFNPKAKSWAGASGLMQLMPRTASFVARDRGYHKRRETRSTLFEPEVNLRLGQQYIRILLDDARVAGDLFLLATAWNGGPGNLNKWMRKTDHMDDPLFFIESIPSRETRIFIERVFTNLWIYRDRLGQPAPSLEAIAAGRWPVYTPLDDTPQMMAQNVEDRRIEGLSPR